jgi:hypothetical protein
VTISPYAPYSYSKLISSLKRIEKTASKNGLTWKLKTVASTIASNQVPYVVLSNKKNKKSGKRKIVILARQHSGEVWSSYLAEDMINFLAEQVSP